MADNKNEIIEMGKVGLSFLSLKVKLIILAVIAGLLIVVIFPVVAIMSVFDNDNSQVGQKSGGGGGSATKIVINEVVEGLEKYEGATFPMPFETWNKEKDVVTSKFSKSRTITVNGVTQTGAHTGIDLVVVSIANPKICAVASGKVILARAGTTGYGNYVIVEHKSEDDKTFYTLYAHMVAGSIMVAEGNEIQAGQVLGIMGSTRQFNRSTFTF